MGDLYLAPEPGLSVEDELVLRVGRPGRPGRRLRGRGGGPQRGGGKWRSWRGAGSKVLRKSEGLFSRKSARTNAGASG